MADVEDVMSEKKYEELKHRKITEFQNMCVEDLMAVHSLVLALAHNNIKGDDKVFFVTDNKYVLSLKDGIEANTVIRLMTKQDMVRDVLNDVIKDAKFF